MNDPDLLQAALGYASKGLPVFPCNPDNKQPLTKHGFKDACTDAGAVRQWWAKWPNAMIGMPTGNRSGVWVLDIDDPDAAAAATAKLPRTRKAETGKGFHLYWQHSPNAEVRNTQRKPKHGWPLPALPGAEVRGEGGYVILPPSRHPSGRFYTWADDCEPAPAPADLLGIVRGEAAEAPQSPSAAHTGQISGHTGGSTVYGLAALGRECAAVRAAGDGEQEAALNGAGLKLGALIAGEELDAQEARGALISAGLAMASYNPRDRWTVDKVMAKVDRALADGGMNPRRAPEGAIRRSAPREDRSEPMEEPNALPVQPQPLVRDIPAGQPFPVHALGALREAVEAVQRHRQAPIALPAQSALAVASLAVQGHANVQTLGGGLAPLSLYCLTVAASGERKSSCDGDLMEAFRKFEAEQEDGYRAARKDWLNDLDIWKRQREGVLGKIKQGKASRAELTAIGPEPAPPVKTDRLVSEPTYEGLTRLFAEGQPSLGLFSDEGGQFLGGYAMSQDNRQKTLAAMNDAWQGNPIKRTRQGDGSYSLRGRRLAIHLMVQPIVAHGFLSDPLAGDTGFLPRCLICEPPSTIGTRLYSAGTLDRAPLDAFAERLGDILHTGMAMNPETRELHPRSLWLSRGAINRLVAYHDEVERAQAAGGAFETIRGHASKTAEQAARIAGVLTLWADLGAQEVSGETMANAIELARFYLSEAVRLSGVAQISDGVTKAEALRKWMLSPSWGKPWLDRSAVLNRGPSRLRDKDDADKALAILEESGWLIVLPKGTQIEGQARRRAWRIVPA